MSKIVVIAKREFRAMIHSKSFIISMVLMPVFMGGGIVIQVFLHGRTDVGDKKILVVDRTRILFDDLAEIARRRNENDIFDPETGAQNESKFILENVAPGDDADEQCFALSEQVRQQKAFGFIDIQATALEGAVPGDDESPVKYYSNNAVYNEAARWTRMAIYEAAGVRRLKQAGLDPTIVRQATAPVHVESLGLYTRTADGQIKEGSESGKAMSFFLPFGAMMLLFMLIMFASQPMLSSVIEEKQQRIAEVLLGSASPFQFMAGKLLGNVGVSLVMLLTYLAGGFGLALYYGQSELIPLRVVAWFFAFAIPAVFMYGSVCVAIGAACSEIKDAQSLMTPVMLMLVFPMMVWVNVLREPLGSFSTWISLFPPATPMLMVMRICAAQAIPLWQPITGVILVVLSTLACLFAAGRVFRIGILSVGKTPKLTELARWVMKG